jgi:folylpolyglutamate synthase
VGCLTSPHLSDVRERIRLDFTPISEDLFTRYFCEVYERIHDISDQQHRYPEVEIPSIPGYPGFLALLGIYTFVKEGVQIAVIETGIGGENDSTNVIDHPTVTGITTLGMDHMNVLGNSLSDIAWHKAGIFKEGAPAFTVDEQNPSALEVLQRRSQEKRISGELNIVSENLVKGYGVTVIPDRPYQRLNASLALALCEVCLKTIDSSFSMTANIARILERTQLPGRNEIYKEGQDTWLLSAAHNELSMKESSQWFKETLERTE